MKVTHITSYLDGGTVAVCTYKKKTYYIDDRLHTKTKGEVFDSYPSHDSNVVSQPEVWELIQAVKEYGDIEYRKHVLHLLGTA